MSLHGGGGTVLSKSWPGKALFKIKTITREAKYELLLKRVLMSISTENGKRSSDLENVGKGGRLMFFCCSW